MNTKTIYGIFSLMVLSFSLNAQQQSLYSQYQNNLFLVNPAIAATSDLFPVQLSFRQQWVGVKNAPQTYVLSGHTTIGRNESVGTGGFIYHDVFGPIQRTGLSGTFAYRFKIQQAHKIYLGLSLAVFQLTFNSQSLSVIDATDDVFAQSESKSIVPDANFGAYATNGKYFAGISTTQLFEFQIDIEGAENINRTVRHYYLIGGYKFKLNDKLDLEPSFLIKSTEQILPQADINLKLTYQKMMHIGFSYRHAESIVSMVGIKYKHLTFGYAYDYTLSHLSGFQSGSHEIVIGYDIRVKAKSSSLL